MAPPAAESIGDTPGCQETTQGPPCIVGVSGLIFGYNAQTGRSTACRYGTELLSQRGERSWTHPRFSW
jgi:hypothetical protein